MGEAQYRLGRNEAATVTFEAVQRAHPKDIRAIVGLINIASARGDRECELRQWKLGLGLYPTASNAVRKMLRLLIEMGRTEEAEAGFKEHAHHMVPVDLLLACAEVFKESRGDVLLSLIEEHADLVANSEPLRDALLSSLLSLGDVKKAISIWLGPDPSDVRRAKAQTILAIRTTDWHNDSSQRSLHALWKKFGASIMGLDEFPFVCNAIVVVEGVPAALDMLRLIDQQPATSPGHIKLKMLAIFERVMLGDLDDPRTAIRNMVARHEPEVPLGCLRETIDGLIARFETIEAGSSLVRLETGLNRQSACAVLECIIASVAQRSPMSCIRLGDAEGMFLPYPALYRTFAQSDRSRLETLLWGTPRLGAVASDDLAEALADVVQRADIVGIHDFQFCCQTLPIPVSYPLHLHDFFRRGMLSLLDNHHLYSGGLGPDTSFPKIVTSSLFPFDFETHNLFEELFNVVRQVSLITCHARLGSHLHKRFGLQICEFFQVPQQMQHNSAFQYSKAVEHHYPDVFERFKLDLTNRRPAGQITLVAAGFLGKFYCDWIKQSGGIAIDIGSLADYWCGFSTRHPSHSRVRRNSSPLSTETV